MTEKERDELLIRLDERTKKVEENIQKANSPEGFTRCQVHATEMLNLKNSMKWTKRGIFATFLAFLSMVGTALFKG